MGGASQLTLVVKNPPADAREARNLSSIPGWGRSPGEGIGNLLQYPCLENSTDRGTWPAIVHGVEESDMSECMCVYTHTHTHMQRVRNDRVHVHAHTHTNTGPGALWGRCRQTHLSPLSSCCGPCPRPEGVRCLAGRCGYQS